MRGSLHRYSLAILALAAALACRAGGTIDPVGPCVDLLSHQDVLNITMKPNLLQIVEAKRWMAQASVVAFPYETLPANPNQVYALQFNFYLKSSDEHGNTLERSVVLRGKREFDRALRYFEGRFSLIATEWSPGSDNYRVFHSLLANGKSEADAARSTWTGQLAVSAGFGDVRNVADSYGKIKATFWKDCSP